MRNFTKTLVAASLVTATNAYSLGIGGIKLHSSLNQNLNAEIGLMTSGESPEDISVKLAPPAKFDQAGIPWSYFLSKIKFNTLVKPNGAVVIKLTSNEALKEPFLDFLIEVTWPKGSLYREFTVLVDPPASYKQAVVPVITRPKSAESARPSRVISGPEPNAATPVGKSYDAEPITEYGPVRKTDTLFSIANRVKTDDVTAAQMAMAIYEANPDAFAKPNVNALIAGKTLDIPEPSDAAKLTPTEASAQFRQHKRIWRGEIDREQPAKKIVLVKKAPVHPKEPAKEPVEVAEKPKQPKDSGDKEKSIHKEPTTPKVVEPVKPETNNQLKLVPPTEEIVTDKTVVTSKPDGTGVDAKLTGSSAAVKNQLEKDDKNLMERFAHMEKQLEMMQKMLEIKDEQLAAIQNQSGRNKTGLGQKDIASLAQDTVTNPKPADTAPPLPPTETQPEQTPKAPEVTPPESSPAAPKVVPASPPTDKPKPVRVKPVTPSAETVDPYMDYYLIAGGLVTALLSGLGLYFWRKRKTDNRQESDMFAASSQITLPEDDEEMSVALVDDSSAYNVGTVSESAFLSEFTPSEFDAFETHQTEIDPISEADVYLAYGRYQQAEDLMRQAIHDFPERDDCKLKLLEIFLANENKTAFGIYSKELIKQGKKNNAPFWAKVVELAEELSPDASAILNQEGEFPFLNETVETEALENSDVKVVNNPLEFDLTTFSVEDDLDSNDLSTYDASVSAADILTTSERNQATLVDTNHSKLDPDEGAAIDFDTFAFDKASTTNLSASTDANSMPDAIDHSGNELDFNLDLFATEKKQSSAETIITQLDDDNALDFDLSSFTSDKKTSLDKAEPVAVDDFDNSLDFDLSAFTTDQSKNAENKDDIAENVDLDFDLKAFEALGESFETKELEKFIANQKSELDFTDLGAEDNNTAEQDLLSDFEKFDFSGPDTLAIDDELLDGTLDEETLLKDFNFSVTTQEPEAYELPDQLEDTQLDDFNFEFDFGLSDSNQSGLKDKSTAAFDVGDLSDGEDALETKMNLANAYIDMGEMDTARAIAEELLTGTAEQKQAAEEILKKIT